MLIYPGHVTLTSWIFKKFLPVLGIIEMKSLEILASNSMQFRVYGILKKLEIDDGKGEG